MNTEYKFRNAPPRASALIESLRGLGYSSATAIADIIDNSIAAKANHVYITFHWQVNSPSKSYISILDDGFGMEECELDHAMCLGDKSPLEQRNENDLGRFGLGLKTASFSQCRSLTVASKKDNMVSCLRWDLDILAANDAWSLLEGPAKGSEALIEPLSMVKSGTIVLLEQLDRIITPGFNEQNLLDLIDDVEKHLSMVFHRYLESQHPKFKISINRRNLIPWDPFLSNNPLTWQSPEDRLPGNIRVQGFVLPHKDHLTAEEYSLAAGPDGWTAQQGFYVYRNHRLLVAGSWLGLGQGRTWTKEEAGKLARIRLDLSNMTDADWKIDIRKSNAKPPVSLKSRLIRLAEDTRQRAKQVFVHRSKPYASRATKPIIQAWRAEHDSIGVRYRIDQLHPCIQNVLMAAGPLTPDIKAMLRVIEETVPIQRIWLDTSEGREAPQAGFAEEAPEEVNTILEIVYRNMITNKGISSTHARELLMQTEPFQNFPKLINDLPDIK